MADIINLRTARKQKKRREKHIQSEQKRVQSSISGKTRKAAELQTQKTAKLLEAHRLEKPSPPTDDQNLT